MSCVFKVEVQVCCSLGVCDVICSFGCLDEFLCCSRVELAFCWGVFTQNFRFCVFQQILDDDPMFFLNLIKIFNLIFQIFLILKSKKKIEIVLILEPLMVNQ
jgi:hypothetical protein